MGAEPRLRQLRPPHRRQADPAPRRSAGRAIDVGDHALGHFPRPAAAADQAAGRGGPAGGECRRAGGVELRAQACAGVPARQRRRTRAGCAARLLQRRRRLWGQRQPARRQRQLERTRTSSPTPTCAARASPMESTGRPSAKQEAVLSHAAQKRRRRPIRTSTRSSSASPPSIITSTRSAASAGPSSAPGARAPRSTSATRRGATARCARSSEQVSLETRTRALNPKWYEALLEHGYEGVRQIEAHVTNTLGWSATTGQVSPWVYQQLAETYVLDDEMRERLASLNADDLGQARQPADRGSRNGNTGRPIPPRSMRCAGRARTSRTGSKASFRH